MNARPIRDRVQWVGAVDWNRRLFDSLIPLPDGTSYNAYLVHGSEKTALLDAVDPTMEPQLLSQLESVPNLDYLICQHAEQDHSGAIPVVLERYPRARLVCSPKARSILIDHLHVAPDRIDTVDDGASLSLGDRTLHFVHTPWVHWPETMATYLPEEKILFTCDFFGSHLATSELYVTDETRVCEAAKRYYAEIMMPFRSTIRRNLEKIKDLHFDLIAPSHGPLYDRPQTILDAYREWVSDRVTNRVVLPYTSMHGSTEAMVDHLTHELIERDVMVDRFELSRTDLGKLAMALVDAATLVIGTPTVHLGPHPVVYSATHLANALRPKLRYAAIIGSYGWGTRAVEQISDLTPNLQVEVLGTVLCKGMPREKDRSALTELAGAIHEKHQAL